MAFQLSLFGRLQLCCRIAFVVLPSGLFNAARAAMRAWWQRLPLNACLWNGFARSLTSHISLHQLQAILPSAIETYRTWCMESGRPHVVDVLADGATHLLWLSKGGEKVVLFFHGGGYVMPLSPGHLDWMAYVQKEVVRAGVDLSVCILEYDLIPDHPYPRQMAQAIQAFQSLLAAGYAPGDITFGGDSAGGHLSLSLLSHLHRPRPDELDFSGQIDLRRRVKGCFLVSPLASFDLSTRSYHRACSADVLGAKVVGEWGQLLVQNTPWHTEIARCEGWGMALDVPETWWEGLSVVDRVLVTGGEWEVFRDHIVQLIDVLHRKTCADLMGLMALGETHDGPLMDFSAKRAPGETAQAVTKCIITGFQQ